MSMPDDAPRRFEALLEVVARLAGATPTGRIVMAKGARLAGQLAAVTAPLPPATVETILREAWGCDPGEELDSFEPEPVACTPTSQIHRAMLDGAPVAVKVLRPGLATAVRQDLVVLDRLLAPLSAALPRLDGPALLSEARERILDELDLEHEAEQQRRVMRILRGHPGLTVPPPVTRLASENVLVSAWVDGTPVLELTDPDERDRAAARLVVFVLGGLRAGIVHADADPADILLAPDGRLAILDFGSAYTVEPARADLALAAVEAFAREDGAGLGIALEALGVLPAGHGPAALELAAYTLGELGGGDAARLDAQALGAAGYRLARRREQALELLLAANLPPRDLWPLRAIAQLAGTLARLGATADWRELVAAALRDGWDAAR
jgi:predicted unusual protein kinase regulating ubiquinone biosynthesis (AarF/ABC1/UbiB family)